MKVRAKITAGTHPVHGPIVEGQLYDIEDHQMADQLFEQVTDEPTTPPAEPGKKKGR